MNNDRIRGALLGTAIGDALGMPVEGMAREDIRREHGRIERFLPASDGTLEAGQWTDDTQLTFVLVDVLASGIDSTLPKRIADAYRELDPHRWGPSTRAAIDKLKGGMSWRDAGAGAGPTNGAAMRAAPFGVVWAALELSKEEAFDMLRPVMRITHGHPASVVAAFGQAFAVRRLLLIDADDFRPDTFWQSLIEMTDWAERMHDHVDHRISRRLTTLEADAPESVDQLLHATDGAGIDADASWPFAAGMFCRFHHNPSEAVRETVEAGGDADTTAAMVGALSGALHGFGAFPTEWRSGIADADELVQRADNLIEALGRYLA